MKKQTIIDVRKSVENAMLTLVTATYVNMKDLAEFVARLKEIRAKARDLIPDARQGHIKLPATSQQLQELQAFIARNVISIEFAARMDQAVERAESMLAEPIRTDFAGLRDYTRYVQSQRDRALYIKRELLTRADVERRTSALTSTARQVMVALDERVQQIGG